MNTREKIVGQAEAWANILHGTNGDEESTRRLRVASRERVAHMHIVQQGARIRHVCMDRPGHALAEAVVSASLFN